MEKSIIRFIVVVQVKSTCSQALCREIRLYLLLFGSLSALLNEIVNVIIIKGDCFSQLLICALHCAVPAWCSQHFFKEVNKRIVFLDAILPLKVDKSLVYDSTLCLHDALKKGDKDLFLTSRKTLKILPLALIPVIEWVS